MNRKLLLRSALTSATIAIAVLTLFSLMDLSSPQSFLKEINLQQDELRDVGVEVPPKSGNEVIQPTAFPPAVPVVRLPSLSGRIVGPDSLPAVGASVTLYADLDEVELSNEHIDFEQTATSDQSGRFNIRSLQEQTIYTLHVDHADFVKQILPNITVPAGKTKNLAIRLEQGGGLHGRIIDEMENALEGVEVTVYDVTPESEASTAQSVELSLSSSQGEYRFDHLSPGIKRVVISKDGYATATRDMVNVLTGEDTALTDFVLGPGARIVGQTISALDGSPLESVRITAYPIGRDNRKIVVDHYPPIESNSGGEFSYDGLAPGAYRLSFDFTRYARVEIVHNTHSADETIEVQLTLLPTVQGSVVDGITGRPVEEFRLVLTVNEEFPLGAEQTAQQFSNEEGVFEYLDPSSSGDFYLFALADGYPPSRSEVINLANGEYSDDVVIEMLPGARLRGRVTDMEGNAIANVRLSLRPLTGSTDTDDLFARLISQRIGGMEKSTLSNLDGIYEFRNLAEGRYAVTADHAEFASSEMEKVVVTREDSEVAVQDLTLTRGARLKGIVMSSEGKPIANAEVYLAKADDTLSSALCSRVTQANGGFDFFPLPPGQYGLQINEMNTQGSGPQNELNLLQRALKHQPQPNVEFKLDNGEFLELKIVQ